MSESVNVVVGTPVYRRGAFVLDKFLANQKEIQQNYPASALVLATEEDDFIEELERLLSSWGLKGKTISFAVVKPDYARNKAWNLACGREAIRQYVLSQTEAGYLLFLDADITVDPNVIETMEREIQGYDVVYSGYAMQRVGIVGFAGLGCAMLRRDILQRVSFRCLEFKNSEVFPEDALLELDLIRAGSHIKKGLFLTINHYESQSEARSTSPGPLGLFQKIRASSIVRYTLIRLSLVLHRDIPGRLGFICTKLLGARL